MTLGISPSVLPTASAATATESSVTMYSDPGDYIGGGRARTWYPGNGLVRLSGSRRGFSVGASGGTAGGGFEFEFAPPAGEKLGTGLYTGAQRAVFRDEGQPGIDISGDGRGCNEITGSFDIKELRQRDGVITRLWLTYEQHCEGGIPATWGEIRINMPRPAGTFRTSTKAVWWPDRDVGGVATVVPITVWAGGESSLTVTSAQIVGLDAADFVKRVDDCTGVTLAPGDACEIWVRSLPITAGPHVAVLKLVDSTGAVRTTQLDAFGVPGRTRFTMKSDAGDYIGAGGSYTYTPTDSTIGVAGSRTYVGGGIDGANGDWWYFSFDAPSGDILAPGTYDKATRYPFNGTGAGLDISGNGRGCNTLTGKFTVTHARFYPNGGVRSFAVDFEQHCEGATPALRGTLEYRLPVGDVTPPAAPSNLVVQRSGGRATVSWTNPGATDYQATIVRYAQGDVVGRAPNSGRFAQGSTRTKTSIRGLSATRDLVVWVYAIDDAGNVSPLATKRVAGT